MTAPIASGWSESPGGPCTHWKAPPFHGARRFRPFAGPRSSRRSRPKPDLHDLASGWSDRLKRLFASGSPLCGNRRLSQLIEQRLGLFEVGGIEAFGEPAEDWGEQGGRLLRPALLAAQAGEACRAAQFPGLC